MARERGWLDDDLEELADDPEFHTYGLLIEINEGICARMDALGMSRAELARKLGVSRAAVTKMLNGQPNMTLKRLVTVAMALHAEVEVNLRPKKEVAAEEARARNRTRRKKHSPTAAAG